MFLPLSRSFIVSVITLLSLTNVSFAQNPTNFYEEIPRTFIGGLVGGVNFTQVDGDSYAGYHKVGFNVGGVLYANLAEHLAASIEILYSQKGARSNQEQLSNDNNLIRKYNIDINYAEIPIQINYFDKRRSHFGAGLSISRAVTTKEFIDTDSPNGVNIENFAFKKMDYNFIIGGNLHLVKALFANVRFQYSLLTIRNPSPPEFSRQNEQFNNMWVLRLMYLF